MQNRRKFLSMMGLSTAGVAVASAAVAVKENTQQATDNINAELKAEIEQLKASYEALDGRSKLLMRALLAVSGLNMFL